MENGLLYRVGIDSAFGGWNAPCRSDGAFCYVPIPEGNPESGRLDHHYDEFSPFVTAIGGKWPGLTGKCHLDPDFAHLTYGDGGSRAQRLREYIRPGSFIVFWSALRWLDGTQRGKLVCSIVGFYTVSRLLPAKEIGVHDSHRNAHTRRLHPVDEDVVVFADPRKSGRLRRHVPIGNGQADGHQRVFPELLAAWGDLCRKNGELLKDGYIQPSGNPPIFKEPQSFLAWFDHQGPELVHANNVFHTDVTLPSGDPKQRRIGEPVPKTTSSAPVSNGTPAAKFRTSTLQNGLTMLEIWHADGTQKKQTYGPPGDPKRAEVQCQMLVERGYERIRDK